MDMSPFAQLHAAWNDLLTNIAIELRLYRLLDKLTDLLRRFGYA